MVGSKSSGTLERSRRTALQLSSTACSLDSYVLHNAPILVHRSAATAGCHHCNAYVPTPLRVALSLASHVSYIHNPYTTSAQKYSASHPHCDIPLGNACRTSPVLHLYCPAFMPPMAPHTHPMPGIRRVQAPHLRAPANTTPAYVPFARVQGVPIHVPANGRSSTGLHSATQRMPRSGHCRQAENVPCA